jgi:hypothetical protein
MRLAATHRCSQPEAADRLEELAAAMAGLTVESISMWPEPASAGTSIATSEASRLS